MERVIITAMGRGPLVGVLLVAWVGAADAGGTRKVEIDSDPTGAAVYLESLDNGTACTSTPCTIEAPIGSSSVILRKDGYEPEFKTIDVPKRGKVKAFKFALTSSVGTLVFDDPALKGATIKIDDVDKGVAPQHIDVEATSHHVVVTFKGKELFGDFVAVDTATELQIKAKSGGGTVAEPGGGGEGGGDEGGGDDGTKIKQVTPGPVQERFITAGVVFDVNFRQFRYDNPQGGLASQEIESGQDLMGPAIELWPMELFGASHLRGLSLFGKVEFGVNHLQVLDAMTHAAAGTTTFWGNIEVDVRHRWKIGDVGAIELGGGFVRDQMEYNAQNQADLDKVPVVDYKSIRLGARGGAVVGDQVEIYGGLEGRIVLDGGLLATRFDKADITGGRVAVGASTRIGPVFARLEGSLLHYGWTFTNNAVMAKSADGASDNVEVISILVGIVH